MKATVNDYLSIQVKESLHKALQGSAAALTCAGESLGKSLSIHAAGAGVKAGAKVTTKASIYGSESSVESLFRLGFPTALSGSAIGIVAGVAVAVNIAIEGPLLARAAYKLHRKKRFGHISPAQFENGVAKATVTSVSTSLGSAGGAILGQAIIPVPIFGAALGATVGGIGGQAIGRVGGWAAERFVLEERAVTMLPLATPQLIDPPPTNELK